MSRLTESHMPVPPVWDRIFKKDSMWLREMEELQSLKPTILPTLIGSKLRDLLRASKSPRFTTPTRASSLISKFRSLGRRCIDDRGSKDMYLILVVHDWSGELPYSAGTLLESLRSFRFVSEWEVTIIGSGITLNIAECLGGYSNKGRGWLHVSDPSRVFSYKSGQLHTSILLYGEHTIRDVEPQDIGGIEGRPTAGKRAVKDICSIRMRLGNGKPVYRVLEGDKGITRLKNIVTVDEYGQSWVTHWKEVKSGWREW